MARELKFLAALILAFAVSGAGISYADVPEDREVDPVVMTADQLPKLLGAAPEEVVAFGWFEGWGEIRDGWEPAALQVDERKVDVGGRLVYADPDAGSGADNDPGLDANDELAMMALDAGLPAGDRPAPEGVDPASRTSIRVSDPLEPGQTGWIYLFRAEDGRGADGEIDLVEYDRDFDPLLDYSFPEKSAVTTSRYELGIRGRWMLDRLTIAAANGDDKDVLDGDKLNVGPGACERSELSLSRGEGGFLADIDGPVRAIRSVTGEKSGTTFQRDYIFYEGILDTVTAMRGLPAGSKVVSAFDLSRQARGMTYRNEKSPGGVKVDGNPDDVPSAPADWEQAGGRQGTLTSVTRVAGDVTGRLSFHEDQAESPSSSPISCSGDAASLGAAGSEVTLGDGGDVELARRTWFEEPEAGAAAGRLHSRQVDQPLEFTIDATEPAILVARARPSRVVLRPGQRRTIRVVVRNHGRKRAERVKICARTAKWARAKCRAATKLNRGGKVVRRITVRASRKARKGTRVLPIRATASKARSYGDRVRVSIRRG